MPWDKDPRSILEEIYEDDFSAALRDVSLDGLSTVSRITNVDTGRLRGAWTVTIGTPLENNISGKSLGPFAPEALVRANGAAVIKGAELGDVIYIQNNVEYGVYVDEDFQIVERAANQTASKFGL